MYCGTYAVGVDVPQFESFYTVPRINSDSIFSISPVIIIIGNIMSSNWQDQLLPTLGFDPPIARSQYHTEWDIVALTIQAPMAGSGNHFQ